MMKLCGLSFVGVAFIVLNFPLAEFCRPGKSNPGFFNDTSSYRRGRGFLDDDTFLNWPNYDCIQPRLYLGNALAASDLILLNDLNITHVLTIDTKHPDDRDEYLIYRHIYAYDSVDQDMLQYFDECHNFINSGLRRGSVFIHCRIGVSRSATIVIAYLMRSKGWDYKTAYRFVKRKRPEINPNPGFIEQLKEYERILNTGKKVKCLLYAMASFLLAFTMNNIRGRH